LSVQVFSEEFVPPEPAGSEPPALVPALPPSELVPPEPLLPPWPLEHSARQMVELGSPATVAQMFWALKIQLLHPSVVWGQFWAQVVASKPSQEDALLQKASQEIPELVPPEPPWEEVPPEPPALEALALQIPGLAVLAEPPEPPAVLVPAVPPPLVVPAALEPPALVPALPPWEEPLEPPEPP
jgi:hypothetical protein